MSHYKCYVLKHWSVTPSTCLCVIPGQLDQAATWLLENAETMGGRARSDSGSGHGTPLSGLEVKADSVCICFIDDCLDCDIPLAELTFSSEYNRT